MSTATTSKVRTALVIGGGIAGPVVATALLKAGIQATVYEAYPTLAEGIGGGLALAPNGLAALGLIGADDTVRALATPVTGTVMAIGGHAAGCPAWRTWSRSRSSAAATCTGCYTTGRPSRASASSTVSAWSEPSKARIRSRRSSTTAAPRPPTS